MTGGEDETDLRSANLQVRVDPAAIPFDTTAEVDPVAEIDAQPRASRAIELAASIPGEGFNIYAMGAPGSGRRATLRRILATAGDSRPPLDDWVYVNNFDDEHKPRAIALPFGTALPFRDAMIEFIEELSVAIPTAFASDEYKTRREALESARESRQEDILAELRGRAEERGIAILRTPVGFAFAPLKDGEIVKPEVFQTWSQADRERIEADVATFQRELGDLLRHQMPLLEKDLRARVRELDRETAGDVIRLAIAALTAKFRDVDPIRAHLDAVERDLRDNFAIFLEIAKLAERTPVPLRLDVQPVLRRYVVNVMETRAEAEPGGDSAATPLVEETEPTFANLMGRIEHQTREGALYTDFTMIRPGALHRANGGFLILDMREVLTAPFAWQGLKRCLKSGELRVSSLAEQMGFVTTTSLDPDPIPLSVRVALIGDRLLFYMLSAIDPDFPLLFKVLADFDDDIDRSEESVALLARMVATLAGRAALRPFAREGVARLLVEASRMADDAAKLTLRLEPLADLMREADHLAGRAGAATVGGDHVGQAVEAGRHRAARLRERTLEAITRGVVTIATDGTAVGQVNGLSVLSLGLSRFGRPARITATVRMGGGRIVDIEREVKLGGPLHSKGVLILSSFLAARFGRERPVSLAASIVFEQSYGGIDGDSASSAELYALLSALSEVPIRQALAVTGSVDQHGRVQAIGGVNEKIEGFYELCAARGLTGEQGVLIPRANVQHLNLRDEVAEAVREGHFRLHAVGTVEQGIALLTGVEAGEPDPDGRYPARSVLGRVDARLAAFAEAMRRFAARGGEDATADPGDAGAEQAP